MLKIRRKTLDYEKPIINTYPHTANIFAIMKNNPYIVSDLAVEMVGLVYDNELDRLDFSISLEIMRYMNNYPHMYCHGISRTVVEKKWKKFSSFVEDMIDDGYYIQLLLDTYYISAYSEMYHREHFMHNPMIFGYDKSARMVIMADSFEKGIYETRTATYDEINNGFLDSFFNDWLDGVRLCKLKEDPFTYTGYNAKYMVEQIKNFLTNKNTTAITYEEDKRRRDIPERFSYGLEIYDEITGYFERVREQQTAIDIRILYALYDHFNLFKFIIEQLIQRKQLKDGNESYSRYIVFASRAKNMYMQAIKYNMTHSDKALQNIIDTCKELKVAEQCALEEMVSNIIVDADILPDDSITSSKSEMFADSIYIEFGDENHWRKRMLSDDTYYADKKGSYFKCQLYGQFVNLSVKRKEGYGIADVFVDGKKFAEIDYANISDEDKISLDVGQVGYHSIKVVKRDADGSCINISKISVADESFLQGCNMAKLVEMKKCHGDKLYKEYGSLGRDIMGAERKLPEVMTWCNYRFEKAANIILFHHTADNRGVGRCDENGNIAAYALSDKVFNLDIVIPGDGMMISFYFVDYDRLNRGMKMIVKDGDTEEELMQQDIREFHEGVLVSCKMKGHLKVYFEKIDGPDAVLSAVFFD